MSCRNDETLAHVPLFLYSDLRSQQWPLSHCSSSFDTRGSQRRSWPALSETKHVPIFLVGRNRGIVRLAATSVRHVDSDADMHLVHADTNGVWDVWLENNHPQVVRLIVCSAQRHGLSGRVVLVSFLC